MKVEARIHDEVAGSIVPMVVVVHALAQACVDTHWRMTDLHATGNIERLFPDGIVRLEESLPREVDWKWIEVFSLLVDEIEFLTIESLASIAGEPMTITCFDSSYWEISGSASVLDGISQRFDAIERERKDG